MRSQFEIEKEKAKLYKLKKQLPEFSNFGTKNWLIIDYQLDILDGELEEDEVWDNEDLDDEDRSSILEAQQWLDGTNEYVISDEEVDWTEEENNKIQEQIKSKNTWKEKFQKKQEITNKRRATLKSKSELEKFRTRWKRWLAQKCRIDKPHWVELLDSNWVGWTEKVYHNHNIPYKPLGPFNVREVVWVHYMVAIDVANMEEFQALDAKYCWNKVERKNQRWR